jgi:hypothetical protein
LTCRFESRSPHISWFGSHLSSIQRQQRWPAHPMLFCLAHSGIMYTELIVANSMNEKLEYKHI